MNISEMYQSANVLLTFQTGKTAIFTYQRALILERSAVSLYEGKFQLTEEKDKPFSILTASKNRTSPPNYVKIRFSKVTMLELIAEWLNEAELNPELNMNIDKFKKTIQRIENGIKHHHQLHKTPELIKETTDKFHNILLDWNASSYKDLKRCLSSARYNPLLESSKCETDVGDGLFCVIALVLPVEKMKWALHETMIANRISCVSHENTRSDQEDNGLKI